MLTSTKLKVVTLAGAVMTGGGIAVLASFSSGISQSVEVGGVNQYPSIGVRELVILPTTAKVCLDGSTCSVFMQWGGTGVVQFGTSAGNSIAGTIIIDMGTSDLRGGIRNSTASANCSGNTAAVCINDPAGLAIANGSGTTVATISAVGIFTSAATTGNQFACSGAASCNFASASGQAATVDCGGGTCTASLGGTNATTTEIGRASQTTTIAGNVTFSTPGPNLGSATTGAWSVFASGLLTATTNYGAFSFNQSANNMKFRAVTCTHATAGTGTAATLAIRNVTDGTTLCSGSYTCTTIQNTPTMIFDCDQTPTKDKVYALQFTTGCGTIQVTSMGCNIEIAH